MENTQTQNYLVLILSSTMYKFPSNQIYEIILGEPCTILELKYLIMPKGFTAILMVKSRSFDVFTLRCYLTTTQLFFFFCKSIPCLNVRGHRFYFLNKIMASKLFSWSVHLTLEGGALGATGRLGLEGWLERQSSAVWEWSLFSVHPLSESTMCFHARVCAQDQGCQNERAWRLPSQGSHVSQPQWPKSQIKTHALQMEGSVRELGLVRIRIPLCGGISTSCHRKAVNQVAGRC